jgi:hypothetical protein
MATARASSRKGTNPFLGRANMGGAQVRGWTEARDRSWDRTHGVRQGSPRDNALDQARGIRVRKGR